MCLKMLQEVQYCMVLHCVSGSQSLQKCFLLLQLGGAEEMKKEKSLHPLDIDAYWLQRRLSKFYDDAMASQAKAAEVLSVLRDAGDDRDCENQLVLLLGYDCFDFIKLLKKHRHMSKYRTQFWKVQSREVFFWKPHVFIVLGEPTLLVYIVG